MKPLLLPLLLFLMLLGTWGQINETQSQTEPLNEFRVRYSRFVSAIHEAITSQADSVVLSRLGDDLDSFRGLVEEVITCIIESFLNVTDSYHLLAYFNL